MLKGLKKLFGREEVEETKDEPTSNYKVGDRVEARYRGRERYIKGTIVRDCLDGSYDIDYVDGGKEVGVREELIKPARKTFNYSIFAARTSPSVLDMNHFKMARVMVDFTPEKAFQLPLVRGDVITVIAESTPDGWSKGIDSSGQCGFYPADHVRILTLSSKVQF